jgi:hypothetical protein
MYINVTTDPVELWAAPESRSRVEREFFDSKFEPFYRTEQIILRPVGLDKIVHKTANGPITFGPVFQKDFLLLALELQNGILEVDLLLKNYCIETNANFSISWETLQIRVWSTSALPRCQLPVCQHRAANALYRIFGASGKIILIVSMRPRRMRSTALFTRSTTWTSS